MGAWHISTALDVAGSYITMRNALAAQLVHYSDEWMRLLKERERGTKTTMMPLYCLDCGRVLAVEEGSICDRCEKRAEVELAVDQIRRETKQEEGEEK